VSIAPIVNFQSQIAILKFMKTLPAGSWFEVLHGYKRSGDTCGAASALLVSKRNKLVADGKGTDSGSFAKMIGLLLQPARP
jgi:hypothetical protein